MSDQNLTSATEQTSWLTPEESEACRQIAASADQPHRQRAVALLALTDGATYAQAAEQAGLTLGQVKYCATAFRGKRMEMFTPAPTPSPAELESVAQVEPEPIGVITPDKPDQEIEKDKKKKDKGKPKKNKDKKKKNKKGKDKGKKKDKKKQKDA